ncbi:hypothetical protein C8R44DRAFT_868449 [Mycena epipterygia]|nr:hypothetical protein C8R44DRAFT_868449 [Mycena epipterygia]
MNTSSNPQALGEVMGCLTLPHLCELRLARSRFSDGIILWPVSQSESLSSRSSFRDTLRVLELPHVTITADDLIQSLASLGSLERLVISDQYGSPNYRIPKHCLITEALLLRLASTPDSSDSTLIPKLNYIACTSFFNFTAHIYFDFITSRVAPGRPSFQAVLRRHRHSSYHFDPEVAQKLMDLVETGSCNLFWTIVNFPDTRVMCDLNFHLTERYVRLRSLQKA